MTQIQGDKLDDGGSGAMPDGPGCQPTPSAASASSQSGIPIANGYCDALSRARIRSYSHKQRDLTLEFSNSADLTEVVTRVGLTSAEQAEASGYDRAVASIAVAFIGPLARKAFELLELVANNGGQLDAEDARLDRFCDDCAGHCDTINFCFDAGYLAQCGSDDNYTVKLLQEGWRLLAQVGVTEGGDGEAGSVSEANSTQSSEAGGAL
jgi:hypothetical protein